MAIGLLTAELLAPLERHLLPLLSIQDFLSLILTCRSLKTWLEAADPAVWRTACKQLLPASLAGPAADAGTHELLQPLRKRHTAKHNLLAGRPVSVRQIKGGWPAFSPDGGRVPTVQRTAHSSLCRRQFSIAIFETSFGTLLHEGQLSLDHRLIVCAKIEIAWAADAQHLVVLFDRYCWTVTADIQVTLGLVELPVPTAYTSCALSPYGQFATLMTMITGNHSSDQFEMQLCRTLSDQLPLDDLLTVSFARLAWDPSELRLAFYARAGSNRTEVRLLHVSGATRVSVLAFIEDSCNMCDCRLAWTADGQCLVGQRADAVHIWGLNGQSVILLKEGYPCLSADGQSMASCEGCLPNYVKIWSFNVCQGEPLCTSVNPYQRSDLCLTKTHLIVGV